MLRFCLILPLIWVMAGCTGQTIEGRWQGPLPYRDARDCRTKIYTNGNFEVACKGNTWVGEGRYDYDGKHLTLNYILLTHNKEVQKQPPSLNFLVQGEGNRIELKSSDEQQLTWQRITHD